MQRIVLDTNVLVSALIQRSYPYLILSGLFVEQKVEVCLSEALLAEYYDVLRRRKFARYPDFVSKAELMLTDIETKSLRFRPRTHLKIISDQQDNRLLELAQECKADFLITGNTNDFTMAKHKHTRIVSPKQYWEDHRPL
jgi:putative PIN family toxin of toxin-antitoxin system